MKCDHIHVNHVELTGNLVCDPEMRYTPNGTAVCEFRMASNESYKKKDGSYADKAIFIDCTAFAKTAEMAGKHLFKGRAIFIESGRLHFDKYQTKNGDRQKISIIVDRLQFVDKKHDVKPSEYKEDADVDDDDDMSPPSADEDIPF